MRIASCDEWSSLKSVVVGTATGARVPRAGKDLLAINYAGGAEAAPQGLYPSAVVDEANEDLEALCEALRAFGAQVYRPTPQHLGQTVSNGLWESEGYYAYCPRDSFLVVNDTIIEAPMPLRARYHENFAYRGLFLDALRDGANWISAPKPLLRDEDYADEDIDRDTLTLRENEPCFDAANVLRCGRDLFYLVSNSGNGLGAQWLRRATGLTVHEIRGVYSYMHLDSTIAFLRPGLVLLNPARINEDNLPAPLRSWDRLYSAPNEDIGFHAPYNHASTWIGMNLLSLDENTVVVESRQTDLIAQLEGRGLTVVPIRMRHARTLGGCIHCVTNDLERAGGMDSYF